jgi:hypothetical protein
MLEEGHDHNIPSMLRGILEWIEALLCRVAKTHSHASRAEGIERSPPMGGYHSADASSS